MFDIVTLRNIYELNIYFNMYNVVIIIFYIYFIFVVLLYWKASIVNFHLSYINIDLPKYFSFGLLCFMRKLLLVTFTVKSFCKFLSG